MFDITFQGFAYGAGDVPVRGPEGAGTGRAVQVVDKGNGAQVTLLFANQAEADAFAHEIMGKAKVQTANPGDLERMLKR